MRSYVVHKSCLEQIHTFEERESERIGVREQEKVSTKQRQLQQQ